MEYKELVEDFAKRTRINLKIFRRIQIEHPKIIDNYKKEDPQTDMYEVTQLINSLLGLLVFPREEFIGKIPNKTIDELKNDGWPIPKIKGHYNQANNLNQLVRYLRNAIAHCNIEFSHKHKVITGLELWNKDPHTGNITWHASMTIDEIDVIGHKFIELILKTA
jgi:hypothetical protein